MQAPSAGEGIFLSGSSPHTFPVSLFRHGRAWSGHDDRRKRTPTARTTLTRHPGLEPGSIHQEHVRLHDGSRLKAGMTEGEAAAAERGGRYHATRPHLAIFLQSVYLPHSFNVDSPGGLH